MFVFAPVNEVTLKVEVNEPNRENGKITVREFRATWTKPKTEEGDQVLQEVRQGTLKIREAIHKYCKNVLDVLDPTTKKPLLFSEEFLDQLLDSEYVAKGLLRSMVKVLSGQTEEERIKN